VDPTHLDGELDSYHEHPVAQFGSLPRMVNRNDDAVTAVLIAGRVVVEQGEPTPLLGTERTGSFLRVGKPVGAPRANVRAT
jgi:N-acyl-D-aspartate/D-glutamate deacylase